MFTLAKHPSPATFSGYITKCTRLKRELFNAGTQSAAAAVIKQEIARDSANIMSKLDTDSIHWRDLCKAISIHSHMRVALSGMQQWLGLGVVQHIKMVTADEVVGLLANYAKMKISANREIVRGVQCRVAEIAPNLSLDSICTLLQASADTRYLETELFESLLHRVATAKPDDFVAQKTAPKNMLNVLQPIAENNLLSPTNIVHAIEANACELHTSSLVFFVHMLSTLIKTGRVIPLKPFTSYVDTCTSRHNLGEGDFAILIKSCRRARVSYKQQTWDSLLELKRISEFRFKNIDDLVTVLKCIPPDRRHPVRLVMEKLIRTCKRLRSPEPTDILKIMEAAASHVDRSETALNIFKSMAHMLIGAQLDMEQTASAVQLVEDAGFISKKFVLYAKNEIERNLDQGELIGKVGTAAKLLNGVRAIDVTGHLRKRILKRIYEVAEPSLELSIVLLQHGSHEKPEETANTPHHRFSTLRVLFETGLSVPLRLLHAVCDDVSEGNFNRSDVVSFTTRGPPHIVKQNLLKLLSSHIPMGAEYVIEFLEACRVQDVDFGEMLLSKGDLIEIHDAHYAYHLLRVVLDMEPMPYLLVERCLEVLTVEGEAVDASSFVRVFHGMARHRLSHPEVTFRVLHDFLSNPSKATMRETVKLHSSLQSLGHPITPTLSEAMLHRIFLFDLAGDYAWHAFLPVSGVFFTAVPEVGHQDMVSILPVVLPGLDEADAGQTEWSGPDLILKAARGIAW
eukprot:TRINITY_DN5710_c1_g2_i1.p1 TRINITY_DN5710_c1_g2~~TRINITY_DN5710_c1_g2_i1.p1  ORF type:complete len:739 (+),score=62.89 TRINITY_DN5710_c1_g2_i1:52-2268(+)